MTESLSPRESGDYIMKLAKNVTVIDSGIVRLSKMIVKHIQDGTLGMSNFSQCDLHPDVADETAVSWILVVDTLNFCFWSSTEEKWSVNWRGKSYTGYFALCAAINRALSEGYKITDATYFSDISIEDVKHIFRGESGSVGIPLIKERQKCLHQVGKVLLEKYGGSFVNCIKNSNNSAEKLLQTIVKDFECFRDEGEYNSVKVSFHKRAQILIGDIWACFKGAGYGFFKDIDVLTMFADYRVPQVLVYFGTMKYSDPLWDKLMKGEILEKGSDLEMEIRGCSIYVVERLVDLVKAELLAIKEAALGANQKSQKICNSILVDHILWDYRRAHSEELNQVPFHKTLSIFY